MMLLDQVKDAIVEEEEASDTLTCPLNSDFVPDKTNDESSNSLNGFSKQKPIDSLPCETYLVLEVTLSLQFSIIFVLFPTFCFQNSLELEFFFLYRYQRSTLEKSLHVDVIHSRFLFALYYFPKLERWSKINC